MSSDPTNQPDVRAAHRIMMVLMETLTASSDLVAEMAQMLGEDATRSLTTKEVWARYLEAKRKLESVHDDMHRFAEAATAAIERENAELAQREALAANRVEEPSAGHSGDGSSE